MATASSDSDEGGDQAEVVSLADKYRQETEGVLAERAQRLEDSLTFAQRLSDGGKKLRLLLRAVRHELARRQAERLADKKLSDEPEHVLEERAQRMHKARKSLLFKDGGQKYRLLLRAIRHELTRRQAARSPRQGRLGEEAEAEVRVDDRQLQGEEEAELKVDDRQAARSVSPQPRPQVEPAYTKEDYIKAYHAVSPCVVKVFIERKKTNHKIDETAIKPLASVQRYSVAATGIIVNIDRSRFEQVRIIVAVHCHCFTDSLGTVKEVVFFDGVVCDLVEVLPVVEGFQFKLLEVVEFTPHDTIKCAQFSVEGVTAIKEEIFSVVSLGRELCMFKSRIIQSNCEALDACDLTPIEGSQDIFSFGCPLASTLSSDPKVDDDLRENNLKRIIGAPVFNMSEKMVGTIDSCGVAYDLKFGRQGLRFSDELTPWLLRGRFLKRGRSLAEPTKQAPPKRRKKKA